MAKETLLSMTQEILASLTSDEVNDIDDTTESVQVVAILKATFDSMVSNRNWSGQGRLLQITPSGDDTLPTHMSLVDPIKEIKWVNYNRALPTDQGRLRYEPVKWKEPEAFMRMLNARNSTQGNVRVVIDPESLVPFLIRTDQPPTYYTSFDDSTLIFDSYESTLDDTLQASKIQVYGYVMPVWRTRNDFIPDLPEEAFSALKEAAKSRAWIELKQQANPIADREAQKQQSWLSRKNWRAHGGIRYPDFGRVPRTGYQTSSYPRDPTFRRDQ